MIKTRRNLYVPCVCGNPRWVFQLLMSVLPSNTKGEQAASLYRVACLLPFSEKAVLRMPEMVRLLGILLGAPPLANRRLGAGLCLQGVRPQDPESYRIHTITYQEWECLEANWKWSFDNSQSHLI
jgi:hypothetical protein